MTAIICPHCKQEIVLASRLNVQSNDDLTLKRKERKALDEYLLAQIRQGLQVTSNGDKEKTNALTRLRRNALIRNEGTRKTPKWVLVEPEPEESIYEFVPPGHRPSLIT